MADELSCQEFVELVTAHLEAALDPVLEQQIAEHLRGCAGCEAYLGQIKQTMHLLRLLAAPQARPANQQELLALFRSLAAT